MLGAHNGSSSPLVKRVGVAKVTTLV
jgi:hypothetical protein